MEPNKELCPDVEGKDASPYRNINVDLLRQAIDEVVGESVYTPDYDWQIWHHLQDLEAENGLPEGVTAEDLYQEFNRFFNYED